MCGFYEKVLVTQSCLTLCDPMDSNLPGSSVHGISQARILEWVAIPLSRGSPNRSWIYFIAGGFSTVRATRKALWFSTIHSAPQGSYPFAHFLCPAHSWCYILLESRSTVLALSVGVSEAAAVQTRPWPAGSSRGLHWGELSGLPRGHVSST